MGETPVQQMEGLALYYGTGHDELHLAFNFPFINAPLDEPTPCAPSSRASRRALPDGGVARLDRVEPRHVPVRHPVGRR